MQPIVDVFHPRLLISPPTHHKLYFTSMKVKHGMRSKFYLNFLKSFLVWWKYEMLMFLF